jgi:phosphinothricin acetyltransferase
MDPLSIRPAREEDLPRLAEIYNHFVVHTPITFDLEPFSVEQRRPWFEQFGATGRHRLLVAEEAGVVLGYAGTHRFRVKKAYDPAVETSVYCAPEATGRRIGTRLYAALFEAVRSEDIRTFIAGITLPNPGSIALHERNGFVPVGTMRSVGRKFGKYWDVRWYERLSEPTSQQQLDA